MADRISMATKLVYSEAELSSPLLQRQLVRVFTDTLIARFIKIKLLRDKSSTTNKAVLISFEKLKEDFGFAFDAAGFPCREVSRTCVQSTGRFLTTTASRPTGVSRTEITDTRVCYASHMPGHISKYCPKRTSKKDRRLNC